MREGNINGIFNRSFFTAMYGFMTVVVALAWAAVPSSAQHHRVLILAPMVSRSLYNFCSSLGEALGEAGHDVTFVSSFRLRHTSKHDVRHIHTGANNIKVEQMNLFEIYDNPYALFPMFTELYENVGREMWANEEMKLLWRQRNEFHAIIIVGYTNEMAAPFLLDYQGVFINLCTPGIEISIISHQGNWLPFSTVPSMMTDFTQYMPFLQRAMNPLNYYLYFILYKLTLLRMVDSVVQEVFPGMPPVESLYTNSSLTLVNGHFSIDGQAPLLPTQVEIGTISAKRPEPLPQDLEDFVEGAGDAGVILFSLGSIVKAAHIPRKYKDVLLEAFGRLPQRVVWKYEGNDLELPPNVMAKAWLPQQDLLGHNRTRLFISHCGNLGLQEAQYHGVPILGMPLAFDQPRNAHRMVKNGFGLLIDWNELTVDALLLAVDTLLHTPQFQERLRAVSRALKDQKESPKERAVWWVEYAIRHKGAPHLAYAGRSLHYLQYIMVDVVVFWLTVLAAWLLLSVYCLRKVLHCCRKPRKHIPQGTKKHD